MGYVHNSFYYNGCKGDTITGQSDACDSYVMQRLYWTLRALIAIALS